MNLHSIAVINRDAPLDPCLINIIVNLTNPESFKTRRLTSQPNHETLKIISLKKNINQKNLKMFIEQDIYKNIGEKPYNKKKK